MKILSLPFLHGWTSLGSLALRIGVGVAFALHGWEKWQNGPAGVAGFLGSLGIPAPEILVWPLIVTELVGGVLVVLGLLTRFWSVGMMIDVGTAMFTAHAGQPIYGGDGGTREVVFILFFSAMALALYGPGRVSLDRLLGIERG